MRITNNPFCGKLFGKDADPVYAWCDLCLTIDINSVLLDIKRIKFYILIKYSNFILED